MKDLKFLNNLVHTNRWSGKMLLKDESVSDHVWGMEALAIEFVTGLSSKFINDDKKSSLLKDLIYRISIHDIGESLYCDIPRDFKYSSKELGDLINQTEDKLLESKLDKWLFTDIKNSKDKSLHGILISLFDALQAGLKMKSEIDLGNSFFKKEILNSIECLEVRISEFNEICNELDMSKELVYLNGYTNGYITNYLAELNKSADVYTES